MPFTPADSEIFTPLFSDLELAAIFISFCCRKAKRYNVRIRCCLAMYTCPSRWGLISTVERFSAISIHLSGRTRFIECLVAMKADQVIPNIQIRAAAQEDIESIASVLYESFAEFEPAYTPEAFVATTPTNDQIRARWSEGPVWVAVSNSTVVGTVSAVVKNDSLYVRSMAVLPAARGQNIGLLLLKEVEAYALEHSYKGMFLSTTPFLTQAIKLYERCGFRRTSNGPYEISGTPLFTMEKILK